jgi:predicted transposase YbfD/YdcC
MNEAERQIGDETTCETRCYISSLSGDAQVFGEAARVHWGIENNVH